MRSMLLPNKHLSWSALELWEKDPREYMRVYFEGGERFTNAAMSYGSKFARAVETGDAGGDEILNFAALSVPKHAVPECRLYAEMKTTEGRLPLLGFADSACYNPADGLIEYKTGATKWTQSRVDAHGQLTFYALIVYLRSQTLISDIKLVWLPTEKIDGRIELTGEIITFSTRRTLQDVMHMMNRAKKVAGEISASYQTFLEQTF